MMITMMITMKMMMKMMMMRMTGLFNVFIQSFGKGSFREIFIGKIGKNY